MTFSDLTVVETYRGLFSLIFVVISLIIGLKILMNYFKLKKVEYLTVGLTWIFLSTSWWWPSFNFLSVALFSYTLSTLSYLILANFFIPVALMTWIYSLTRLIFQKQKKLIIIGFGLICGIYETILIIFLFINPDLIGVELSPSVISRTALTLGFAIFGILVAFITGVILGLRTIQREDALIKWKGRFLLIAFILFTLGAGLDAISWTNLIIIVLIRVILIISGIAYYFGFFLPDKVANWLIKE